MYYIGVDLGTSAVKLLLMTGDGKIEKIVSEEYPLYFPHPGWSEQKPEDWLTAVVKGIRELTEGIDRSQVAGIGAGGQMHGLVVLDKDDQVIRPAILWNDGRTQEETDYLNQTIGKEKIKKIHRKYCICWFYRSEDPVAEKARTGEFFAYSKDNAPEGLYQL